MTEIKSSQVFGTPALDAVYISEMDMWPLEGEDFNRNFQFYNNLREGRFTTTKCKKCGHIAFPPGVICPECWSDEVEWVDLPKKAKVVTFTETVAGAPLGFESPLVIAWLGFEKGAPLKHLLGRVINCPEGKLREGDEVKLVVYDVPSHPMDVKRETKICDRVYYAWERVEEMA